MMMINEDFYEDLLPAEGREGGETKDVNYR